MTTLAFVVRGDPVAQPRPRAYAQKIGSDPNKKCVCGRQKDLFAARVRPADDDHPIHEWKDRIAYAAKPHRPKQPLVGPIILRVTFYFQRPQSHYTKRGALTASAPIEHLQKPDVDNCIKAVKDVCTEVGIWVDDSHVNRELGEKEWCEPGNERAVVGIWQVTQEPNQTLFCDVPEHLPLPADEPGLRALVIRHRLEAMRGKFLPSPCDEELWGKAGVSESDVKALLAAEMGKPSAPRPPKPAPPAAPTTLVKRRVMG